jgi:circadian clock protein KaiC
MTTDAPELVPPAISTGVPGLDIVLGGGLRQAGLYLIEGRAGGGKTILASQIAFHRAAQGETVLYLTVLAEAHGKLLGHLRQLDFFDESRVSQSVVLLSGYQQLTEHGLDGLLRHIAAICQEFSPSLLVVDGFRAAATFADDRELARFLHQLDLLITAMRCTTLLLSPLVSNQPRPEHTLVDGLIELSVESRNLRRTRLIEVHKLRGAAHYEGRHVFRITSAGIHVFPRLEAALSDNPPVPEEIPGRVASGIDELDRMMGGGVMPGSTTAIMGAPGAGKTLMGLSFLDEGLRRGERVLYFGFYESPQRLVAKAEGVGLHLQQAVDSGQLTIQWQPALELVLDEIGELLLGLVERIGAARVFIDGIEGFRDTSAYPERHQMFVTALTVHLRAAGVTTFFSQELPLFRRSAAVINRMRLSAMLENILLLRYTETQSRLRRLISIVKMRENVYDGDVREFRVSDEGFVIGSRFESDAGRSDLDEGRSARGE